MLIWKFLPNWLEAMVKESSVFKSSWPIVKKSQYWLIFPYMFHTLHHDVVLLVLIGSWSIISIVLRIHLSDILLLTDLPMERLRIYDMHEINQLFLHLFIQDHYIYFVYITCFPYIWQFVIILFHFLVICVIINTGNLLSLTLQLSYITRNLSFLSPELWYKTINLLSLLPDLLFMARNLLSLASEC